MALSYMPKFFAWGKNLTSAILGENKLSMIYDFDGVKVYENISPYLNEEEKKWLKNSTKMLCK